MIGSSEWLMRGTHAWQDDIYRIVSEYLDDVPERTGPVDWDDKIDEFGFESVESLEIRVQRSWTPDETVGYLLSLSYCSPKAPGDQQAEFEAAVRDSLAERDESRFVQNDVETVISGVNPGRERR